MLLWFVTSDAGSHFYDPETAEFIASLAVRFGVNENVVRRGGLDALGMDSLDLVELVMELEEQFD